MVLFSIFFKQKTAYEMSISDWSSDVCSSDLQLAVGRRVDPDLRRRHGGKVGLDHEEPLVKRRPDNQEQEADRCQRAAEPQQTGRRVGRTHGLLHPLPPRLRILLRRELLPRQVGPGKMKSDQTPAAGSLGIAALGELRAPNRPLA